MHPRDWSVAQVADFLTENHFPELVRQSFMQYSVAGAQLPHLNNRSLTDLGMNEAQIKHFLSAIGRIM